MKRKLAALLLCSFVLVLPACGKKDETPTEPAITFETPAAEPTEEPA